MKFIVYRTSHEAINHPKVVKSADRVDPAYDTTYSVKIETLEDLLTFCNELGCEVIIRDDRPNHLEVYDSYRE